MPEAPGPLLDRRGRRMTDLRISVTDRCNFRCGYCMPRAHFGPGHRFLPRTELLTFEEIARFASIATHLGVRKVRLTGGEPLLRRGLPELVRMLAGLPGIDLALTTNGALLAAQAGDLARAGLGRVTVSLDAIDPAAFRAMSDSDYEVSAVLEGIDAAARAGLGPIKINSVIRRGLNEDQILPLARKFRNSDHVVRFIEFMDVGATNEWRLEHVVTGGEIVERIGREFPLEPLEPAAPGEVARRFRYADGAGEIGVITSVTQPFCGDCTRLRLSSEGQLYTCLFATTGRDVRAMLRGGASDAELALLVSELWQGRDDRYSELRAEPKRRLPRIEMSYIGG